MLVFYFFVFIPVCCLLKLHALCFLKYFSSPIFVGLDEEYRSCSPRLGSATASLLDRRQLEAFPLFCFPVLYVVLYIDWPRWPHPCSHCTSPQPLSFSSRYAGTAWVHLTPGSLQSLLLASVASQFCHLALNCTWLFPKLLEEKMAEEEVEKKEDCHRDGGHNLKLYTER